MAQENDSRHIVTLCYRHRRIISFFTTQPATQRRQSITQEHQTTRHKTTRHDTTHHITSHRITSQHNTALHCTSLHFTAFHFTTQHNTTQHNTTHHTHTSCGPANVCESDFFSMTDRPTAFQVAQALSKSSLANYLHTE